MMIVKHTIYTYKCYRDITQHETLSNSLLIQTTFLGYIQCTLETMVTSQ